MRKYFIRLAYRQDGWAFSGLITDVGGPRSLGVLPPGRCSWCIRKQVSEPRWTSTPPYSLLQFLPWVPALLSPSDGSDLCHVRQINPFLLELPCGPGVYLSNRKQTIQVWNHRLFHLTTSITNSPNIHVLSELNSFCHWIVIYGVKMLS